MKESAFKSIPGKKKRETKAFADVSVEERERAVLLVRSILHETYKCIWRFDPEGLYESALSKTMDDGKLVNNV